MSTRPLGGERMAKLKIKPNECLIAGAAVAVVAALVFRGAPGIFPLILAGGLAVAVALLIWLGRRFERMTPADKFDFFHAWKIPDPATRGAIWLIAAFDGALYAVIAVVVFALVYMAFSRSFDISVSPAATIAVSVMASGTLGRYWRYRRRYEPIAETGGPSLRYAGESSLTFREKCGVALAIIGVIIAWHAGLLIYLIWFA